MLNHDSSGEQELLSYNFSLKDSQISHIKRLSGRQLFFKGAGNNIFYVKKSIQPTLKKQTFCPQHSCLQGARITSHSNIPPVCDYLQGGNIPGGDSHMKRTGVVIVPYRDLKRFQRQNVHSRSYCSTF